MTEARRQIKIMLLKRRMGLHTFDDLARESNLAVATVHNVIDGIAGSRKSRQAITDALQSQIWPDVSVSRWKIIIPAGLEIDFGNEREAIAAEAEFGGVIKRIGTKVEFADRVSAFLGPAKRSQTSGKPDG
jgi:hypothetical protein